MRKQIIAILFLSVIISFGCGSGGGGGSSASQTEAELTAKNAPQAISSVSAATSLVGTATSLGELGSLSKTNNHSNSKPPIMSILDKTITVIKDQSIHGHSETLMKRLSKGSVSITNDCLHGGTVKVNVEWDGPSDPSGPSEIINLKGSITFSSCEEGTETMNGTLNMTWEGSLDNPTKFTFSLPNFSYADSATNNNIAFNEFSVTASNMVISDFEMTSAIITMSGSASGLSDGNPIDAALDNFKVSFNSDASGDTLSVSGRIKPSCLDGWITIKTNISLFIPSWTNCPNKGEVILTSGSDNVLVTFSSNYNVSFFLNNNQVKTYNNCDEMEGLCVG